MGVDQKFSFNQEPIRPNNPLLGSCWERLHDRNGRRGREATSRIVKWLLIIVGALVAVTFVTALAEGPPLVEVLLIALVLLMSAVPVALPVMFTVPA